MGRSQRAQQQQQQQQQPQQQQQQHQGQLSILPGNCVICTRWLRISNTSALRCGHCFHALCISEWLEHRHCCPICRADVVPQEVVTRLYFDEFQTEPNGFCIPKAGATAQLEVQLLERNELLVNIHKVISDVSGFLQEQVSGTEGSLTTIRHARTNEALGRLNEISAAIFASFPTAPSHDDEASFAFHQPPTTSSSERSSTSSASPESDLPNASPASLSGNQELLSIVRSVFNKVTPTTLDVLSDQFIDRMKNVEQGDLEAVCDLIVQKAAADSIFANTYARVCALKVESDRGAGKSSSQFQRTLIRTVQVLYERGAEVENKIWVDEQLLSAAIVERRRAWLARAQHAVDDARRQWIGVGVFVASLFIQGVIPNRVIQYILLDLVKKFTPIDVEMCVRVVETCGHALEKTNLRILDIVFMALRSRFFTFDSTRLRCLVLDLEDLRARRWQRKPFKAGPMPLDELYVGSTV